VGDRRGVEKPGFPVVEKVDRLLREVLDGDPSHLEGPLFPALDIFENQTELVIEAELPGVDPDDVRVSCTAGHLIVEGRKTERAAEGRVRYLCMERSFGLFRREVPLPHPVNPKGARAEYRQGILIIRLPRMPEKRGEQTIIPITTGEATEETGE
jgi:HSP20 family protein